MKEKLTLEICLRELADNAARDKMWGIRVGKSSLDFEDVCIEGVSIKQNVYRVIDWNGDITYHTDLIAAIMYFISIQ